MTRDQFLLFIMKWIELFAATLLDEAAHDACIWYDHFPIYYDEEYVEK